MRGPGRGASLLVLLLVAGLADLPQPAAAQSNAVPRYLRDRGTGIPASIFGTFIRRGELLVYPFYAYSRDNNREYQPAKLGFGLNQDFRGRFHSSESLIFVGYGITDWLAVELEGGHLNATLDKSPLDPSATPPRIKESGLGDLEAQLRFRIATESEHRPEVFGFVEMTPATQTRKVLISEPNWDLKPGLGVIRGFGWGTMIIRIAAEYNREARSVDLGEVAIEYLKRLSPSFRINAGIEGGETGAPDEFDLVTGVQWRLTEQLSLKFDNALGLSSKATDWAPQIGAVFSFEKGRSER
jgi:hypothetical protein